MVVKSVVYGMPYSLELAGTNYTVSRVLPQAAGDLSHGNKLL